MSDALANVLSSLETRITALELLVYALLQSIDDRQLLADDFKQRLHQAYELTAAIQQGSAVTSDEAIEALNRRLHELLPASLRPDGLPPASGPARPR
jgi:hypothetical protein